MSRLSLIVASITGLLMFGSPGSAHAQAVPEAPQAQKKAPADKPAAKTPEPPSDNSFPEDVSRAAAKAAEPPVSDAQGTTKPASKTDNPFPEAVSRDAAKATELPPGVSSSQSGGDAGAPEAGVQALPPSHDPVRARKDTEVGAFYLKAGDYKGALQRYKDAASADPTNLDAIFGLAETQRSLKNNAEAARNYQLYLDIVPDGPKAKQALKALKTLTPQK